MACGKEEALQMINERLDALEASQKEASDTAKKQAETTEALAQTLARLDDTISSLQSFLETWKALQGAHKTVSAVGNAVAWLAKAGGAVLLCWGAFKYMVQK